MLDFLKQMLSNDDYSVSSKRVITFLAFLVCCAALIGDQFFGFKVNVQIFQSMMVIVVSGLGFTASEKFAPPKQ